LSSRTPAHTTHRDPTTASGGVDLDPTPSNEMLGIRGLTPVPHVDPERARAALAGLVGALAKVEKYATEADGSLPLAAIREAFATLRSGDFSSRSTELAAALHALVRRSGSAAGIAALCDLWIHEHGLRWAFEAVLETHQVAAQSRGDVVWFVLRGHSPGLGEGRPGIWAPLRAHLAAADDDTYTTLRARADEVHTSSDDETRLALAFAFPEAGFAHEEARAIRDDRAPRSARRRASVIVSSNDPALAEALVRGASSTVAFTLEGIGGAADGLGPTITTMHGLLGEHVVGPLALLLRKASSSEATKAIADVLARVGTPEAIEVLASRVDERAHAAALTDAARRFPRVAVPVLATIATRNHSGDALRTLLKGVLRREREELADTVASLPDAARKLCRKLLADDALRERASLDELPEVLAKPRWEGARKTSPPTLKGLPASMPSPRSAWPAELRERWQKHLRRRAIAQLVQDLRLSDGLRRFVVESDDTAHAEAVRTYKHSSSIGGGDLLALGPRAVMRLARLGDSSRWDVTGDDLLGFAAHFDLASVEVLLWWGPTHVADVMPALFPFGDARIASIAVTALGRPRTRAHAEAWLAAHPAHAAAGLLPLVFGKAGKPRDAAMAALRVLERRGHRVAIDEAARALGAEAVAGLEDVFAHDELDLLPSKIPSLPSFFVPDAFTPPVLAARTAGLLGAAGSPADAPEEPGKALPLVAIERLGVALALGADVTEPYPGIARVKEACTADSLAAFSWELFDAWCAAGCPNDSKWAFLQLAWLGDDVCVRRLAPRIRAWPGEGAHARAATGLDVLLGIGTDVALMHLHHIAERSAFRGLREHASSKIAALAEARGLTPIELADRLVPDLGLDEDGSLELDLGTRRFRVGFDESLTPFVRDTSGEVRPDLPKPSRTDDPEKAKAAAQRWRGLKEDARTIAAQQVARLELAMVDRRRWALSTFRTFLVEHPLVGHLTRRVLWGTYAGGEDVSAKPKQLFRVDADRSFSDASDAPITLDDDAWVGVVHPLELSSAEVERFAQVFADYELVQPFPQLARETYALPPEEADGFACHRVDGVKVPTARLFGLQRRGWRRGPPQDGGVIQWLERALPGSPQVAILYLSPGIVAADASLVPEQTLRFVNLGESGLAVRHDRRSFRTIGAIAISELLRDLESLRP